MKKKRNEYIAQFYRGNRGAFFLAVLTALLATGLHLIIARALQQMIDGISGVPGAPGLAGMAGWIGAVLVLILLVKALEYHSQPRFIQKAMQQYKEYAFRKLTEKSLASFDEEASARYLAAFSHDAETIETGYLEGQFHLLTSAADFIGALVMMLLYSPAMTGISCAFFILPAGVSLLMGKRIQQSERRVSQKNETFTATLKDSLGGFSVMKSFRAEGPIQALFAGSNRAMEQAKCHKRRQVIALGTLASLAGVLAQLGTFWAGAWLAFSGAGITPGVLIIFINLAAYVIEPLQVIPERLAALRAAEGLIDKLADALEEPERQPGAPLPDTLRQGIELRNVSFAYKGETRPALAGISARFAAGGCYAVVGGSGSGKSTLLGLLTASRQDYSGEILYDGQELKTASIESLYDLVGLIQQDVFLFDASIRDNITLFRDFPPEQVEQAIRQAGLAPLIAARGTVYRCGENGRGLSGGEQQRVAIARSLLKRSQVLLVDEATAALDPATARQVTLSILELAGITRILVTHRLDETLLRRCDGILALKDGRLAESGTFDQLMNAKGYFYSLFTVAQ